MPYIYRRSSGTFYARVRVPDNLRAVLGSSDLRKSLRTTDYHAANKLALEAATAWKQEFQRIEAMLDANKLAAGSPILLTSGLIQLDQAAEAAGLKVETMLREAIARRSALRLVANGWLGAEVPRGELVDDQPDSKTLVLDVGETLYGRPLNPIFGHLYLRPNSLALIEQGEFSDCLFFRDAQRRVAVVAPFPGQTVPIASLMIDKAEAEAIRRTLAGKLTPASGGLVAHALTAPKAAAPEPEDAPDWFVMGAAHKHKNMRTSQMLEAFYAAKNWKLATRQQNEHMCNMFVDLMGDPRLGDIDRDMVLIDFRSRLTRVPMRLGALKAKHRGKTFEELIALAATEGLPTFDADRAGRYIAKIGEAFVWGVQNEYLRKNFAADGATKPRSAVRPQTRRQLFTEATLHQIFSVEWFRDGVGARTAGGQFHFYQPFYYWLPLLGLYTGARINELSQLYLKDIKKAAEGTWYLDFNLDGDGKLDADNSSGDKQLKTLNSIRVIPIHAELIRLGLAEYVEALKATGEIRLFPELLYDPVKGYGKWAGQWFNARFLGNKLNIVRDSTQSFHSFRHTFLTACDRLDMPDRVRNELAGHGRGEGQGHSTYIKDRRPEELAPHLSRLTFPVPTIAPFDQALGLQALRDAMERKRKAAARSERRSHNSP